MTVSRSFLEIDRRIASESCSCARTLLLGGNSSFKSS